MIHTLIFITLYYYPPPCHNNNKMLEDKNGLKLKHLQKYFVPAGIDAKVILQAFKMQENKRMLASCRSKQFAMEQKIEEQVSKLDLLQVTGRQSVIPQSIRRSPHKKGIKDIRLVFDNPINRIVDVIAQDPDSRLYQRQLSELQRFSSSSSSKVNTASKDLSTTKGIFSQKDLQTPLLHRQKHHSIESSDSMEYYEQLILNNPVLYRKIMMAYNASKRHLQREQQLQERRIPQKRETVYETKFRSNIFEGKNLKCSNMMQLREFQLTICLTNRILVFPQPELQYRAFICKGNNGLLVKSILKTRPWWSLRSYSDVDTCNLVWTEWKKTKVINRLTNRPGRTGVPSQKQPDLVPHSKKRELALLADKKIGHFKKIVSKEDPIWLRYEKTPQFQNYLKFTNKATENKFQQMAKAVFPQSEEYSHSQVQKQHRIHNHIPGCLQLHSKKLLFHNLKTYYQKQGKDIFSVIPLTFHITKGVDDLEFAKFTEYFEEGESQRLKKQGGGNVWILKPGQNSNRGNGITVSSNLTQIKNFILQKCSTPSGRSVILQKYVQNPFLYNRRKFDIRCYILITTVNGIVKGYWYEQGYIRTASKEFNLKNLQNRFIHLTNDAIQKRGEDYGKFQNYNKVSYSDFEKYVEQSQEATQQGGLDFATTVLKMKQIATHLIESTACKLNPKRKEYSFQIFGLDFMLDQRLNPLLIEANSNPCIEVDGAVLGKVIPAMLENVIRVAIDPVFPPPLSELAKNRYNVSSLFQSNKLVLVYDSYFKQPKQTPCDVEQREQRSINEDEPEQVQILE